MRILLAGGSGGLGQVTARLLARDGHSLVVGYLQNAARAEALADIAEIVQADITDAIGRRRLLDAAGGSLEGLAVFTGNPARVTPQSNVEDQMNLSHAVNYRGPLLLAREAAAQMRQNGAAGAIVLFSTMQGLALFPDSSVYAGAKAALIHGGRILAKELRGQNIRVNIIAPGVMAAGMAEASIASGKYDHYLSIGAIPRFGRAEDIARTVRFLLEPDNYITGQVLSVDGGITL